MNRIEQNLKKQAINQREKARASERAREKVLTVSASLMAIGALAAAMVARIYKSAIESANRSR